MQDFLRPLLLLSIVLMVPIIPLLVWGELFTHSLVVWQESPPGRGVIAAVIVAVLAADVFLAIVQNDLAVLRRFRRQSSLATYLTVVSRRIVVKELLRRKAPASLGMLAEAALTDRETGGAPEQRLSDREEVARLLEGLNGSEEQIVRKYHLEGKSYREISNETGMPENSIGPTLNRARGKMRGQGGPVTT